MATNAARIGVAGVTTAGLIGAGLVLTGVNALELGGAAGWRSALQDPTNASFASVRFTHAWLARLAVTLLAGAGLGAAGAVMQHVLRNPIASPMTLGVAAGAQLALSLLTLMAPGALALYAEPLATLGGAGALALVLGLTWHRDLEPVSVVLAGLVVSIYFGAINAGLLLFFEYDLKALLLWGSGALSQHDWSQATFLTPRLAIAAIGLGLLLRPLTVLTLDARSARGLGLAVQRARLLALGLAVYVTAIVVSAVGIIGFVGLCAPALARQLGARTLRQRLVAAPALGALLLLITDQCVQQADHLIAGVLPTGAVTAVIGAPVLFWLLRWVRPGAPASDPVPHSPMGRIGLRYAGIAVVTVLACLLALLLTRDAAGWHLQSPLAVLADSPWRAPRVVAAGIGGLLLALAGTILQRLLHNPMASPEVLGISGGALAGVTLLVFFAPAVGHAGLVTAGTAGALVTSAALLAFARGSSATPERILLVGIAVKALTDGLLGLVAASGSPLWTRLLSWVSGSTYGTEWPLVLIGIGMACVLLPLVLALHRWLTLLGLGDATARARGLAATSARLGMLSLAALATALATLLVGPLSFIGLLAPHMARFLGLEDVRGQLAGAAALGASVMMVADWLGRTLLVPYEWPAGLAAAFVGGFYFMILLWRR